MATAKTVSKTHYLSSPFSIAKLPEIKKNGAKSADNIQSSKSPKEVNPFHMPSDMEVFAIRERERQTKKQVRKKSQYI